LGFFGPTREKLKVPRGRKKRPAIRELKNRLPPSNGREDVWGGGGGKGEDLEKKKEEEEKIERSNNKIKSRSSCNSA